jgi:hypothetical protein
MALGSECCECGAYCWWPLVVVGGVDGWSWTKEQRADGSKCHRRPDGSETIWLAKGKG